MEFSYKAVGTHLYPMMPLIIRSGSSFIETHAILDTGSRFSLFQSHLARQLGLNYRAGKPMTVMGVGGKIIVYVHDLSIAVGSQEFSCVIGFSDTFSGRVNLIGRTDFFDKFLITFDERHKKVILDKSL